MLKFSLRPSIFVFVVCSLVLTSGVSAATVTSVSGKVSINRGSGFAQISSGTSASAGNLVMAGPSGHAVIIYDNGCREEVEPGSVVTVAETPPCGTAANTAGLTTTELVLGAVVVAGGVGAAIALSGNGHHPASP
jgi:hypothetical protein